MSAISGRQTQPLRTILFWFFLIMSSVLALGYLLNALFKWGYPLSDEQRDAELSLLYGLVVLVSVGLLFAGRSWSRCRLGLMVIPLIIAGALLGTGIGSLIVYTTPGCCAISYGIALGFPTPFLHVAIAMDTDIVPRLTKESLQAWPMIYQQIAAYVENNKFTHPDVIQFDVSKSLLSNFIFYGYVSMILLTILKLVKGEKRVVDTTLASKAIS